MKKILIAFLIILPIQVYAVDDSTLIEAASRVSARTFSSVEAIMITDIFANNENDAKTIWKYLAEDWLVKKYCGSGDKETLSCKKFTCKQITSDGTDIKSVDVTSKAANDLTTYCDNYFNIIKCGNNAYYATKDKSKNENNVCPPKTKSAQGPESPQRTGGSVNAATSDQAADATKKRNDSKINVSDQQTPKQDNTPKKSDANATVTKISGFIKDTAGEPLVSATVIEQGITPPNGASADANGKFTLTLKNTENPDIKIEYEGYKTIVKKASEINGGDIIMEEESILLEAAYGIHDHKKGDTCGWSEEKEKVKVENLEHETAEDARKAGIDVTKKGTYEKRNGKWVCKPNACLDSTHEIKLNKDKNRYECVSKESKPETVATPTAEQPQPSEPISVATDDEIEELEKNADAMEDKKNSLANRAIGAAGMGATGIGGMMALSALSEQRADDAAERDMRAYLETFRCNYGSGPNVRGGTTGVELPGGNDMIGLYTQYATLANDLKIRKNALGLKPGVESEIVIDKASTGLYDNTSTGITKGAYASIARAIADPDGEDAKIWNDQKKKTSKNLKTGAIVAGVGAAGSLAANLAVNSGNKDQTKNILDKYKDSRTTKDTNSDMSKVLEHPIATLADVAGTETQNDESLNGTDAVATPSAVPTPEAQTVTCNEGEVLIDGKCEKCGENQEIKDGECVDKNTDTSNPQSTNIDTSKYDSIYDISATASTEDAAKAQWGKAATNFMLTKYCTNKQGSIDCIDSRGYVISCQENAPTLADNGKELSFMCGGSWDVTDADNGYTIKKKSATTSSKSVQTHRDFDINKMKEDTKNYASELFDKNISDEHAKIITTFIDNFAKQYPQYTAHRANIRASGHDKRFLGSIDLTDQKFDITATEGKKFTEPSDLYQFCSKLDTQLCPKQNQKSCIVTHFYSGEAHTAKDGTQYKVHFGCDLQLYETE